MYQDSTQTPHQVIARTVAGHKAAAEAILKQPETKSAAQLGAAAELGLERPKTPKSLAQFGAVRRSRNIWA